MSFPVRGVPASAVEIVHGGSHRRKLVRVRGVRAAQVRALADKR